MVSSLYWGFISCDGRRRSGCGSRRHHSAVTSERVYYGNTQLETFDGIVRQRLIELSTDISFNGEFIVVTPVESGQAKLGPTLTRSTNSSSIEWSGLCLEVDFDTGGWVLRLRGITMKRLAISLASSSACYMADVGLVGGKTCFNLFRYALNIKTITNI